MRSKSYKSKDESNGKKTSNKKGGRNRKFDDRAKLDSTGRDNDPNFYFSNAELAQQAAQLSFQSVVGLGGLMGYKVPSIMRIGLNPCPGVTYAQRGFTGNSAWDEIGYPTSFDDDKHGINLMSSKLYTMLSTFSGRTSQYAPQDVAMMILAISSIAELSEHIRRMFGIALTYNPRNRNLPLGLLRTMGIDVSDMLAHIPEYRMRFNVAMTRINQIPLLDNIGYIRKSREIYQRIYMDSVSPMAQIFYYAPVTVWKLNEVGNEHGSILETVEVMGTNWNSKTKVDDLLTLLEQCITALLESSTLNLIYADLLNMANKINVPVWQFDYLAENYVVMPEFNRNALLQLHHIRIMDSPKKLPGTVSELTAKWIVDPNDSSVKLATDMTVTSRNDVVCDPDKNNVVYNPLFEDLSWPFAIVDMDSPNPTLEDRIEALRYTSISSGSKLEKSQFSISEGASHFVSVLPALPDHYGVQAVVFDNVDYTADSLSYSAYTYHSVEHDGLLMSVVTAFEKFTNCPMYVSTNGTAAPSTNDITALAGNLDFYTLIDFDYLKRLNELMFTGLFDFRV